jgi:hypothetical protein
MLKVVMELRVHKEPKASSEQPESGVLKVVEVFLEILVFKVHSETADLVLALKESRETRDLKELLVQTQLDLRVTKVSKVMMDLFHHLN